MSIEYRIVVTKIERDVPFKNKEYKDTGKKDEDGEKEYAYVYFDDTKDVTKEVFNQLKPDLNVPDLAVFLNEEEK